MVGVMLPIFLVNLGGRWSKGAGEDTLHGEGGAPVHEGAEGTELSEGGT